MTVANTSTNGYLTSTDWNTFNGKYSVGGALGTPSSGVVTNLTGTASININGTVGATTPTTGAFTTLDATRFKVISNIKSVPVGSTTSIFTIDTNNGAGGSLRIVANGTHTAVGQIISYYTALIGYDGSGAIVTPTQVNVGSATITISAAYSGTICTISAQLTGGTASSIGFVLEALGLYTSIATA
jgi:hypothetical protein